MRTLRTALLALVLAVTAASCLPTDYFSGPSWQDEFREEQTLWFYEDLATDEGLATWLSEFCAAWNTGDNEVRAGLRVGLRTAVVDDADLRRVLAKHGVEKTAEVVDEAGQIVLEMLEDDCAG